MKLRVGLVGLGPLWESRYRPALRVLSDRFEVAAICDPVALRAEQASREFGAVPVDGYRALADRPDLDAVLLLSDCWYGTLPILAACDAGKAVYCATSLDVTVEDALQLKRRVEETGVAFMAELPRRHAPATIRLKELIATKLGAPRLLFCHLRKPSADPAGRKRLPAPAAASTQAELMELVDWCRYVVGNEPSSVLGVVHHTSPDTRQDDYDMLSLDFSMPGEVGTAAVAQISCGHYVPETWHEAVSFRPPAGLQVACTNGIAFIDLPANLIWFDGAGRHQESLESERPLGEQVLSRFYRAVTSLVRQSSTIHDAYRAIEIVAAATESYRAGKRLPIPDAVQAPPPAPPE